MHTTYKTTIAKRSSIKSTPSKLRAPTKPGHVAETAKSIASAGVWDLTRGVGEPDYGFRVPGLAAVAPRLRQFCPGNTSAAYRPGRARATIPRTINRSSRREYSALVESFFGSVNRATVSQLPRMIVCDHGPLARTVIGLAAQHGIPVLRRPVHKREPSLGDRNQTNGK